MAKTQDDTLQVRIRFDDNWDGKGNEYFVFENKKPSDDEWGLDCAFRLFDFRDEHGEVLEEKTMINYQALTKIRELQNWGLKVTFGK